MGKYEWRPVIEGIATDTLYNTVPDLICMNEDL